ncbi:MAG TPA: cobyric acid synthase, partial [Chloroflexota bacterium]|nr:cobyric acid synthase [Chloroflexota bacterium]
VDMNPILLEPEGDARSQLVLLGRPDRSMAARDYYARKPALWDVVVAALGRLRARYDLVILEGAGSPAEVNLRSTDIVNMRVAQQAQAPVLLVGDIDRGGVFAALLGTLDLLEPAERSLVAGLIVNKFRGDASLFQSGVDFLVQHSGLPVLGVVPFIPRLRIAEEDGVALEDATPECGSGALEIVVARHPHIANFDEFDLLAAEPSVRLRYVEAPERVGSPDLVILPGSKATVDDLLTLRRSGLADRITALAQAGVPVLGICAGYQMLGERILDPLGVESRTALTDGLGLLPATTTFLSEKYTRRVQARTTSPSGCFGRLGASAVAGYEIHMGATESAGPSLFSVTAAGEPAHTDGCRNATGAIAGCYLHGLFETREVRRALIDWLAARRGLRLPDSAEVPSRAAEYDRLATTVRNNLDIPAISRLAGLGA